MKISQTTRALILLCVIMLNLFVSVSTRKMRKAERIAKKVPILKRIEQICNMLNVGNILTEEEAIKYADEFEESLVKYRLENYTSFKYMSHLYEDVRKFLKLFINYYVCQFNELPILEHTIRTTTRIERIKQLELELMEYRKKAEDLREKLLELGPKIKKLPSPLRPEFIDHILNNHKS